MIGGPALPTEITPMLRTPWGRGSKVVGCVRRYVAWVNRLDLVAIITVHFNGSPGEGSRRTDRPALPTNDGDTENSESPFEDSEDPVK